VRIRIVVWNCNMRLHDKAARLRALEPDLAVIPECACPEVLLRREIELAPSDLAWEGANPAKGLAVLAFGPWHVEVDRRHVRRSGTTLPLHVSGPAALRLLAVWGRAQRGGRRHDPPPEPLGAALARIAPFLSTSPAIVAGDFSHLLLARRADRRLAPTPLARRLTALGFVSAYHLARGVAHGAEPEPTFFRHRRLPGRHHSDHVFLDRATAARGLQDVALGEAAAWTRSSDHLPLVVELDVPERRSAGVAVHPMR
jgi:exodeoxyribonuclease-3